MKRPQSVKSLCQSSRPSRICSVCFKIIAFELVQPIKSFLEQSSQHEDSFVHSTWSIIHFKFGSIPHRIAQMFKKGRCHNQPSLAVVRTKRCRPPGPNSTLSSRNPRSLSCKFRTWHTLQQALDNRHNRHNLRILPMSRLEPHEYASRSRGQTAGAGTDSGAGTLE